MNSDSISSACSLRNKKKREQLFPAPIIRKDVINNPPGEMGGGGGERHDIKNFVLSHSSTGKNLTHNESLLEGREKGERRGIGGRRRRAKLWGQ